MITTHKTRILHIIDSDAFGGAQDLLVGLCHRRNRDAFSVDICILHSQGDRFSQRFKEAADTVIPICRSPVSALRLLIPPPLIGFGRYDIVHTHLWVSFMWGNAWLPLLGKKLIASINHTRDQVPAYYFACYKQFARKNTFYFALNKTIQRDLASSHIPAKTIIWQPIGIDEVLFSKEQNLEDLRRRYAISADETVLLRIARLEKDKKHELFIDAMTIIVHSLPKAKLLIAGEGSRRSHLEEYIGQRGLENNVILCGECRNDLPGLNRIAKAGFALGWGSATTESMYCGLPQLSFDASGADELIIDDENGYLVPPDDSTALADRALRLLADKKNRFRIGEAGRKSVQERFTYAECIKAYERFYTEIKTSLELSLQTPSDMNRKV